MSRPASPGAGFTPPQPEGVLQQLYALKRRRWAKGVAAYFAGGRLVLRIEPTFEIDKTKREGT